MEYSIRVATPGRRGNTVTRDELPRAYEELRGTDPRGIDSPTVTWNDGADWSGSGTGVIIAAVNDKWSRVTLMTEGTEHQLVISDDDEVISVKMEGEYFDVTRNTLAPRETGLEILLRAEDIPGLLTDYTWEAQ